MVKDEPMIALEADPSDPDDFDVSEEELERGLAERRQRRSVGRPKGSAKQQVAIRIDSDVLDHFRGMGAGWQTRMNAALRKAAGL